MPIHSSVTLDPRSASRHVAFDFDVPAGTTQINIRFEYHPYTVDGWDNQLSITIFDPTGFRGAGHRRAVVHEVVLSQAEATPGYLPGPIQAGRWQVVIDAHILMPGAPVTCDIDVTLSDQPITGAAKTFTPGTIASRGPGWYRGDLHGHSDHSDAHWRIPDLTNHARKYHLDFVTLTDHNTISHQPEMESYTANDLLTMVGLELTTFYGHALALGVHEWIDWRVQPGGLTMPMIADRVTERGGIFVIAHPMSEGAPMCSGCDWQYPDMFPGNARFVEVWNGGWEEYGDPNEPALKLWYSWLNQGYRIVATAGTDIHGPLQDPEPGFSMIYAYDLTEKAILAAIRRGSLYITSGPIVELTAKNTVGASVMMGELLPGKPDEVKVTWDCCGADDRLTLIVDGEPLETITTGEKGETAWRFADRRASWCVVEIRKAAGRMRTITNPIFFDRRPSMWL